MVASWFMMALPISSIASRMKCRYRTVQRCNRTVRFVKAMDRCATSAPGSFWTLDGRVIEAPFGAESEKGTPAPVAGYVPLAEHVRFQHWRRRDEHADARYSKQHTGLERAADTTFPPRVVECPPRTLNSREWSR